MSVANHAFDRLLQNDMCDKHMMNAIVQTMAHSFDDPKPMDEQTWVMVKKMMQKHPKSKCSFSSDDDKKKVFEAIKPRETKELLQQNVNCPNTRPKKIDATASSTLKPMKTTHGPTTPY